MIASSVVVLIAIVLFRSVSNNKISFEQLSTSNTHNRIQENRDLTKSEKAPDSGHFAQEENSASLDKQEGNHNNSENILEPGLNRFAFDMSRELCKQERESPLPGTDPLKNGLDSLWR